FLRIAVSFPASSRDEAVFIFRSSWFAAASDEPRLARPGVRFHVSTSSMVAPSVADFSQLSASFSGELHTDRTLRLLYATDASEYQELPLAVALPRTEKDLRALIDFA